MFLIPLCIAFSVPKILGFLSKVQKIAGNLLDKLPKLYTNRTVIQNFLAFLNLQKVLGIFCASEQIFDRKQSLGAPDWTEKKSASPPAPLFLFFDPVLVFSLTVEPNSVAYSCLNRTHLSPERSRLGQSWTLLRAVTSPRDNGQERTPRDQAESDTPLQSSKAADNVFCRANLNDDTARLLVLYRYFSF